MPKKIVVVEDEEDILELVRYNLVKEGFEVSCVMSGEDAIKTARSELPDLAVLDLMLPGVDGLEVCKILKSDPTTSEIPIVMLTARGEEVDVVTGLELGADDYITKPFSPRILTTRIKAILRRKNTPACAAWRIRAETSWQTCRTNSKRLSPRSKVLWKPCWEEPSTILKRPSRSWRSWANRPIA